MEIIDRLLKYKSNEIKIIQLEEDIIALEQEKAELDNEIKISSPNLNSSGKNKKDFVKNNIEPQVLEREKLLKVKNEKIKKLKEERENLIIYQRNTKNLIKCYYNKTEQEIIRLKYFENYRVSEIANEKNITENAVQKILKRIKND